MDKDLIFARVKAFLFEAGSMLLTVIVGALISPDFSALITSHFGTGLVSSVVILSLSGLAKHLYNLKLIKQLGAAGDRPKILI